MHQSENFSTNAMNIHFASDLLSQGSNKRDYILKNVKKISVWDVYDLLFFITLCFPKNDNKHPSEMRN